MSELPLIEIADIEVFGDLQGSWLAAWRSGLRIDRYALVPLTRLRSTLGTLLDPGHRRAIHLPDFYQLCRLEALLSEAVGELERLHRITWSEASAAAEPIPAEISAALVAQTLHVAAILDVPDLLAVLIGSDQIRALRQRACEGAEAGDGSRGPLRGGNSRGIEVILIEVVTSG